MSGDRASAVRTVIGMNRRAGVLVGAAQRPQFAAIVMGRPFEHRMVELDDESAQPDIIVKQWPWDRVKTLADAVPLIAGGAHLPEPRVTVIDPELIIRGST